MTPPTIAIGLDAADTALVDGYVADGTMPALARLRARGVTGRLSNAEIYRAETPWTNFLTGAWPDKTGYWGPIRYNPQTYGTDEAGAYLFDAFPPFYQGVEGRVCIFDVPQTRLQADRNGIEVLGWGSHSQQGPACSSPPGLLAALQERHGVSPVDDETATNSYDPEALEVFDTEVRTALQRRISVSKDLLSRESWRLFLTVVGETHSGGHELWHHGQAHPLHRAGTDRIRRLYADADKVVDALVNNAPDDAHIVVFSLHGMVANGLDVPSMAILPEVLARWSFGEAFVAKGAENPPMPRGDYSQHWKHEVWGLRTLAGDDRLTGPSELAATGDVLNWQPAQWYRPLWPLMRAFALPSYADGTIRFNLTGRESLGFVEPLSAPGLAKEIRALLLGLVDHRTGKPVVDDVVYRPRRWGIHSSPADLVVRWSEAALSDVFSHPALGVFGPYPWFRTGAHRPLGFWTAVGPRIHGRDTPRDGSVVDLSATLMDLIGAERHPWMDGCSLLKNR